MIYIHKLYIFGLGLKINKQDQVEKIKYNKIHPNMSFRIVNNLPKYNKKLSFFNMSLEINLRDMLDNYPLLDKQQQEQVQCNILMLFHKQAGIGKTFLFY